MATWTVKRKGNAKIYVSDMSDYAVVENPYGVSWRGERFDTVLEAKNAAEKESEHATQISSHK